MMNKEQLDAIKERVAKATKWSRVMTTSVGTFGADKKLEKFMETGSYEDAVFIAHSKSDMTDLIAEVERLREALKFYADEENYQIISMVKLYSIVAEDKGKTARQALGGDEND